MSDINTGLVQFQELPAIMENAPQALLKNTNLNKMALAKGQTLLDTIEAEGISPELDVECNKFLGNCSEGMKRMNERRSPITKMLTAVQKEFTKLENELDKDKVDTIPYKIQQHRNELARQEEAKRRKALEEENQKRFAANEAIEIKASVELKVRERYNQALIASKQKFIDLFNTFESVDQEKDIKAQIEAMPLTYPRDKFELISVPVTAIYVKPDALAALVYDSKMSLYDELNANFRENMESHKSHLLEQIPARKQEIAEMEKASKAEKKRLQEAQELRQREEQIKLDREEQQRKEQAIKDAQATKEVGAAQVLFEQEIATASIMSEQTQAVKHSYVIEVKTHVGWMQLLNLWFTEFGSKTPLDKFPTKKLESIKSDCEKLAFNGGKRLDDSAHIEYLSDVKALTKRS